MEKYLFAFHSEIIGYTSPHIGEVRKAILRKVEMSACSISCVCRFLNASAYR
jgi:hypothetical protein